jgi:peptidoglycan/xylan/chitin deacetylase (PgdA/CDA1 family)
MPVSSGSEGIQGAKLLMYHYVRTVNQDSDPIGYRLSVTPAAFEEQIRYLSEAGFRAATVASLLQGDALKNAVALTFDDGYEDFYLNAYPILARYNMTATVYVVSDWVGKSGYLNEEQIRELLAAGFEIGSHTVSHRELHKLSETDQIRQIRDSKLSLEQRFNTQVVSFCYPVGRYTDVTTRLVREAGYLGAVTTQPGVPSDTTNAYTIPRQRVSGGMSLSSFTALVR